MSEKPLVSVCVPAYNCELFIEQTISGICEQTYLNIEIIIVNDGSTDRTTEIIERFKDERITVVNTSNGGASKARNIAFEHSVGDLIIFFDGDDYIESDFITKQVELIITHKNSVVLSAWGRFYENNINTFVEEHTPKKSMLFNEWIQFYWYNCNPMTNPGRAIIPRATVLKVGLWNEELSLNDDLEFFTRIFLNSEKIIFNTKSKFYYRSGIKGLSSKIGNEAYRSLYESVIQSINAVISFYGKDKKIMLGCANMLQSFIYLTYPQQKYLLKKANDKINDLTKPTYKFQAGGFTEILVYTFGWKLTKRIKSILGA